jgi:hypothetical protein
MDKTKDIILLIVTCVCLFLTYELITCNKLHEIQKEELNNKIKNFQLQTDSLNKLSLIYKTDYNNMVVKYKTDSLIADSLSDEIDNAYVLVEKSNNKANYYYNKLKETNTDIAKINYTTNNKNWYDLAISLKNKIN